MQTWWWPELTGSTSHKRQAPNLILLSTHAVQSYLSLFCLSHHVPQKRTGVLWRHKWCHFLLRLIKYPDLRLFVLKVKLPTFKSLTLMIWLLHHRAYDIRFCLVGTMQWIELWGNTNYQDHRERWALFCGLIQRRLQFVCGEIHSLQSATTLFIFLLIVINLNFWLCDRPVAVVDENA